MGDVNYKVVNGVKLLTFDKWTDDKQMVHAFTTKIGGVSSGIYESLNLGFNRGDDRVNVVANYQKVADALGVELSSMVLSRQVHETNIAKVTQEDKGNGILFPNKWESMDGIYTTEDDITLVTHYADCVPLFFYSKKHHIIGMAHAGWRGTVARIGANMVNIWKNTDGIDPSDIEVAIGPSIGVCHFEVGPEVAEVFEKEFKNADFIESKPNGKYNIDLWKCNKRVLMEAGIKEENITVAGVCTYCNSDIYYSHRKTNGQRGTLAGIMCLHPCE